MATKSPANGIPRCLEIIAAACGLAICSPLIAIAAVLIKITSAGPVFFRQKRVGRFGEEFTLFKLRTMSIKESGPLVTAAGDSRVTPIGKILRKSKIDELPELWNVFIGDMSLVGPRPEVPELVNLNDPQWQQILQSRPGITDPVTLRLRNEENLLANIGNKEKFYRDVLQPYKLRGYCVYLRDRNWKTDVKIIALTLKAIFFPHAQPTVEEMGTFAE